MSSNATPTAGVSPFLRLSAEVRIHVYDDLLIQLDGSHRTLCTCPGQHHAPGFQNTIFPAILRTNKLIHAEGLYVLYSKNTLKLICDAEIKTWYQSIQVPQPQSNLIISPGARALSYVTAASAAFRISVQFDFGNFGSFWSSAERDLLQSYRSLDRITLILRNNTTPDLRIEMVRKAMVSKGERLQDYKESLGKLTYGGGRQTGRAVEELCDAVLTSQYRGGLKTSVFGVRTTSWETGGSIYESDEEGGDMAVKEEAKVYLGCDEFTTSVLSLQRIQGWDDEVPRGKFFDSFLYI